MDGLSMLLMCAAWRPELIVSASVVSAVTRGPSILASTAAGLTEAAPGRAENAAAGCFPLHLRSHAGGGQPPVHRRAVGHQPQRE
ncbi:MAG: hypothetical protein ACR2G2_03940 [Pseudonocardia sp.]